MSNKLTSQNKNLTFLKDWPVWLLIYEAFVLFGQVITFNTYLYVWAAFLSILLFAAIGLNILIKYPNGRELASQYILSILIILFFYSPFWINSLSGGPSSTFNNSGYIFFLVWAFFMLFWLKNKQLFSINTQVLFWFMYVLSVGIAAYLMNHFYFPYPLSLSKYIKYIGGAFLMGQFFIFYLYVSLLLPFTLFLAFGEKNLPRKHIFKEMRESHKIFDILYFIFLSVWPLFTLHLGHIFE